MKLTRSTEQWQGCNPEVMAKMSEAAIAFAFADAKQDQLSLRAEIERLRAALTRIGEMDPAVDSSEGCNEWGEADCFRQAQNIALRALGPNVGLKRPAEGGSA